MSPGWTRSHEMVPGPVEKAYHPLLENHAIQCLLDQPMERSCVLAKVGREVLWTLPDSWDVFADHFCVVDPGVTDFFWPKYTKTMEYDRRYDCIDTHCELDFREWLILYTARMNKRFNPEWNLALQEKLRVPVCPPGHISKDRSSPT